MSVIDSNALKQVLQYLKNIINKKQDILTFDDIPNDSSNNPVTSSGVKSYIDKAQKNNTETIQGEIARAKLAESELNSELNNKADKEHTHVIDDVANLQASLDLKSSIDNLNSEINDRKTADDKLISSIESEIKARNDADSVLQNNIDSIPSWSKQETKPNYTANEVGAVSQEEIKNYYTKSDIDEQIEAIPKPVLSKNIKTTNDNGANYFKVYYSNHANDSYIFGYSDEKCDLLRTNYGKLKGTTASFTWDSENELLHFKNTDLANLKYYPSSDWLLKTETMGYIILGHSSNNNYDRNNNTYSVDFEIGENHLFSGIDISTFLADDNQYDPLYIMSPIASRTTAFYGDVYANNNKVLITKEAVESIQSDLESKISAIPKFSIVVVDSLPTSNISTSTVYLVKTSSTESDNLYTEYIYANNSWEQLGTQSLDLSGYLKTTDAAATYAKQTDVDSDISSVKTALQKSIETKQNKLTAGNNVTITGDVISATDTVYDDTNIKSSINTLNTNVTSIQNTVSNDIYTKTQVDNKTTALNDSITTTKTELATAITNKQDILSGSQNIEISDNALNITEYLSNYLTTMDNTKYLYIHRPSADDIFTYYSTVIYTLQDLRSNNTDTVKTIIQKWRAYLLNGETVTYYSSLSDAVSSSNALSSSTGAVVSVASTGFADVYKLLADITVSSDIALVEKPTILMINGYTLTLSSAVISKSNASTNFSNLCIDGTDVGSTIKMVGTAQIKASGNTGLQLIGGTYTISDATVSSAFNVNYIQNSSNSSTYYYPIAPIIMWNTNITGTVTYTNSYNLVDLGYIVSDSSQSLFANNTITLTGAKVGACIARWGGKLTSEPDVFEFINETYKCIPTSGTTYDDYASQLLMFAEGNVIVRNCNLEGINDAVHSNGDLFIENSKLTGHVHGGAYIMGNYRNLYNEGYIGTDIMATRAYIMNTEIIGGKTNPYSCYFGCGANVYCDGVSFKTYDGSDYTPAIKSGDDIGDPAIVYFSNCSMKSLRLDANCHAVLGLGISNTIKNATYNGTKTVDNSVHRYKLVEEL